MTSKWESRTSQDAGLSHSLDLLSDTYNYNHWIYSLCRPWLGSSIMEVGSGTGNLSQFMLGAERLVCIEPEEEYQNHLAKYASTHNNVQVYQAPVQLIPNQERDFDSAICVNVLEHIEDDRDALMAMADRVRSGGFIVLYVPATPWAFGELDRDLGHFRRYTKRMVSHLIAGSDLSLEYQRYINFIGLWGWFWSGRVRKEKLIDPAKARFMDRLVPMVSALERLFPIPVGQSLIVILKKL